MREEQLLTPRDKPDHEWRTLPVWKRGLWILSGVGIGLVAVFSVLDSQFRVRDRASQAAAYRLPPEDASNRARARADIRYRIGRLLRPDEGAGAISGDRTGRDIEIGLLYGRLGLLEEAEGNMKARDRAMADAVRFLRAAGVRNASEQYVRDRLAKQGPANNELQRTRPAQATEPRR
jgi:hypothetical protein